MPRKLLRQMAPSPQRLRGMRSLKPLGDWVYEPNLWHINRLSTSKAFAIGLFSAMIPLPGQLFIAALVAVRWRANLPLSVMLIFVTNPITMPVIYFAAYKLGASILETPLQQVEFEMTWYWLTESLGSIWQPFLLGCLIMGTLAGLAGYVTIDLLWRWRVVDQWQKRAAKRRQNPY
jgi:uncharacterized protein (DUF2062 family)